MTRLVSPRLLTLLLVASTWMGACTPTVESGATEERDGVRYLDGRPFSGVLVTPFPDTVFDVKAGVVAVRARYRRGVKHGTTTGYYPSGQVRFEASYVDGRREGEVVEWREDGSLWRRTPYVSGVEEGTVLEYGPDGGVVLEAEMRDGKVEGVRRSWYASGAPKDSAGYVSGALHGVVKRWFENGQLRLEQEFRRGYPHGPYREWADDGTLIGEGTYDTGEIHGAYRRWHPDGSPALEGDYFRGRSFTLRMWDADGNPLAVSPDISPDSVR